MSLSSWERWTGGFLEAIGLSSIKLKILVFALLATLIPSLTMGWLSYRNNRRAIDDKILQELTSLTSVASRELDLWLKERRLEMRVLSSSYEVSENLERLASPGQGERSAAVALRRLQDYLVSVGKRFTSYRELLVADARGKILASSVPSPGASVLPQDLLRRARAGEKVVRDPSWDRRLKAGVVLIAEPVRSADGAFLGVMGAKVGFGDIDAILAACTKDSTQELYLVTRKGEVLVSTGTLAGAFMASRLDAGTAERLFSHESAPLEFPNFRGAEVLGTLRTVPDLGWGVVAEKDTASAYAEVARLRNVTLALISAVLLAIGLAAYLLGLTIVSPLRRLTQGAGKVAGGDLDVDLPVQGRSEVSYMTAVFNDMVARLRKFRDENAAINQELRERNEELRKLSVTDGLTGLYNRTQLPELLAKELSRSRRHGHPFTLLMADIDHFKLFNDTHGHQRGDELLQRFAEVVRGKLRSCDLGARYGGEEFLILLTETGPEGALRLAETLRQAVEEIRMDGRKAVTVSIGVASFPENGGDVESLIRQADAALYRCKREGRNRVGLAGSGRNPGDLSAVSSG